MNAFIKLMFAAMLLVGLSAGQVSIAKNVTPHKKAAKTHQTSTTKTTKVTKKSAGKASTTPAKSETMKQTNPSSESAMHSEKSAPMHKATKTAGVVKTKKIGRNSPKTTHHTRKTPAPTE